MHQLRFFKVANMYFNAFGENKILEKISKFTVFDDDIRMDCFAA